MYLQKHNAKGGQHAASTDKTITTVNQHDFFYRQTHSKAEKV